MARSRIGTSPGVTLGTALGVLVGLCATLGAASVASSCRHAPLAAHSERGRLPTEEERHRAREQREARRLARAALPPPASPASLPDVAVEPEPAPAPQSAPAAPSASAPSAPTTATAEPSAGPAPTATPSATVPAMDVCEELCSRAVACQLEQLEDVVDDPALLEQLRDGMQEAERLCREKCDESNKRREKAGECLRESKCEGLMSCIESAMDS